MMQGAGARRPECAYCFHDQPTSPGLAAVATLLNVWNRNWARWKRGWEGLRVAARHTNISRVALGHAARPRGSRARCSPPPTKRAGGLQPQSGKALAATVPSRPFDGGGSLRHFRERGLVMNVRPPLGTRRARWGRGLGAPLPPPIVPVVSSLRAIGRLLQQVPADHLMGVAAIGTPGNGSWA